MLVFLKLLCPSGLIILVHRASPRSGAIHSPHRLVWIELAKARKSHKRLPEIELQLLAGGNSSRGWVHSLGKGTKLSRCVSGSPNFGPHFCVPPRTLVRPPARGCTGLSLRPSQAQVSKVEPTPSLGLRGPLNHPCPGCSYCVESHHWDWYLTLCSTHKALLWKPTYQRYNLVERSLSSERPWSTQDPIFEQQEST